MKRIIKFRGYSTDLNKWVYGSLVNNMWTYSELTDRKGEAVCEIITGEYDADCWEDAVNDPDCVIKVLPESVGQFTGLLDTNKTEIYEGDIVKEVYVPLNSYPKIIQYYKEGVIVWSYKSFGVQLKIDGSLILDEDKKLSHHRTIREIYKHPTAGINWVDTSVRFNRLQIIGNIYTSPELITTP